MRMYDIIAAKRDGLALTEEQINFFITEYTAGRVPDYQASAHGRLSPGHVRR